MVRQIISTGTTANDGTGDTLRDAGVKINANFTELYTFMPGGSIQSITDSSTSMDSSTLYIFNLASTPTINSSFTLANGSSNGEIKRIINKSDSDVSLSITAGTGGLAFPIGSTGLTINNKMSFDLVWDGTEWHLDRDSDSRITFLT
jgi:hypothetical protein